MYLMAKIDVLFDEASRESGRFENYEPREG